MYAIHVQNTPSLPVTYNVGCGKHTSTTAFLGNRASLHVHVPSLDNSRLEM